MAGGFLKKAMEIYMDGQIPILIYLQTMKGPMARSWGLLPFGE